MPFRKEAPGGPFSISNPEDDGRTGVCGPEGMRHTPLIWRFHLKRLEDGVKGVRPGELESRSITSPKGRDQHRNSIPGDADDDSVERSHEPSL